jgi:hypothetical protein
MPCLSILSFITRAVFDEYKSLTFTLCSSVPSSSLNPNVFLSTPFQHTNNILHTSARPAAQLMTVTASNVNSTAALSHGARLKSSAAVGFFARSVHGRR